MRNLASPRSRTTMVIRAFPASVALMLVLSLGWLVAPTPAAAQDDDEPFAEAGVSGNSYESPAYGYTLEWDDSVWQVEEAETSDDNDFLYLTSDASDLYFESYERFDGDAVECRDNAVATIEEDERVTEFELTDDGDDDVSAFAVFSYVATINGDEFPRTQYSECRVLVEGEAVLQVDHLAPQEDYEAEAELVAEVTDSLVIPGAEADDAGDEETDATPATDDATEDDATEDDAVEPAEDEEDATVAASDDEEAEQTEAASDDDAQADEDEPTPTEEDEEAAADDQDADGTDAADTADTTEDEDSDAEPTEEANTGDEEPSEDEPADEEVDPDDLEGVDDDTYESPTFGYTLEWDADVWTATAATSEDDVDTLVLENDVTVLTLVGTEEFGENLDRCVRTARRGVEGQDGVEDLTPVEDANGDPIEIDEDERAGAVYTIVSEDEAAPEQVAQIECRVAVPGEAVIQIVQVTPAAEFNDQIDPVGEILDSITVEGAEEDEETPAAEDEPTPDDEEETEDAESAVDGNSYVSPGFGYSVEWDEDVWRFNEGEESSEPGFDTLFLESDNSGLAIIGLEITDPETCVDEFASFIRTGDDVDNWAPFEDEDGERIEGERDGGYFAAFTYVVTQQGQELEVVNYFECYSVVEGESAVLFYMTTSPAAYDDAVAEVEDLIETLTLPDESADDEDAEETPAADEDEDVEPTPDDEEEDVEPTPDDEQEDDSDSTASGDLDTYTDPDFPFSVTWDEGVWSVVDQRTVDDGHNLLNLTAEGSDLTIEGWARWEGEPADCLNDITLNLRAVDGVEDFERVSDTDLYPENDLAGGAYALYSFTLAPEGRTPVEYYGYVLCRTVVEGEAVVVLTLLTPADEYDAIRSDFEPILASIEIDE